MDTNTQEKVLQRTRCAIYTRVMGYHRPVMSFNIWKKSEFYSRKYFEVWEINMKFIQENS